MDLNSLDEPTCADVLAALRWPGGPTCSRCGLRRFYRIRARPRVWECATCGRQQSVTAGTALHRSKVSLQRWLITTLLMPLGVSANAIATEFGISYEAAFQLLHKIRMVMTDYFGEQLPSVEDAPGVWQVGWSQLPTRPPWLRKPNHRVGLIAIELENGWHYAPWRDERASALAEQARNLRTVDERRLGRWRAGDASWHLRRVHGGVSLRWLSRYLAERRATEEGFDGDLLRKCLLWARPRPWRDVPPPLPPPLEPARQRRRSTAAARGGSAAIRGAP